MTETPLMKRIMLAVGALPFLRIFRNNTGMAWQGEKTGEFTRDGARHITLKDPRPIHAGLCVGSADLIGWKVVEVTPDMVGKRVAVFAALEVKTSKGKASSEQVNFLKQVQEAGGIAGLVRSEDDALNIVK
jgi:hypothetical protein